MTKLPHNVLVLMSDEHRRDAAGFMGSDAGATPCLDKLAQRGMVFEQAYTPAPICVPARAAFATGQPTNRTGYWDSAKPYTGQPAGWMHALRDAGIHTATIGKLHYAAGCDHGASEEILPMHVAGRGWTVALVRDGSASFDAVDEMARDVGMGETETTRYDRAVTQAAVDWLRAPERARPWAAFVSLVTPHYPLIAPAEWRARIHASALPEITAPGAWPAHEELHRMRGFFDHDKWFDDARAVEARLSYYGLIAFMDHCMGQILMALEATGQAEDTLVLYVSDHGEMLGDHGFWGKSVMLEPSVAIPMVLAGPGVEPGRSNTLTSLLDIAPTMSAAFGLPEFKSIGRDLRTVNQAQSASDHTILSEHHDGGSTMGSFMIRWDRWKYIFYTAAQPQLFNLQNDPRELEDLAQSTAHADFLAEGERRLRLMCDPEAVSQRALSDQKARLQDLGGREAALSGAFSHTPIPK